MRPSPICCLPLGFRSRARHTAPGRRQARAIVFSFSLSLFLDLPCVQCTQTQPCCRLINNPVKSAVKPTPPNPFFIRIHQAYSTFLFSLASLPTALQGAGAPSVLAGSRLGRRPPSVRERDRAPPAPQHARPVPTLPCSQSTGGECGRPRCHGNGSSMRRCHCIVTVARVAAPSTSTSRALSASLARCTSPRTCTAAHCTLRCPALAPSHSRALRVVRGQAPKPATACHRTASSHSRSHCSVLPPRVICEARLHHETRTKPKRLA